MLIRITFGDSGLDHKSVAIANLGFFKKFHLWQRSWQINAGSKTEQMAEEGDLIRPQLT